MTIHITSVNQNHLSRVSRRWRRRKLRYIFGNILGVGPFGEICGHHELCLHCLLALFITGTDYRGSHQQSFDLEMGISLKVGQHQHPRTESNLR